MRREKAVRRQGYPFSALCQRYRDWLGKQDLVMRPDHRAGEKRCVDYARHTAEAIDRATGEMRPGRRSSSR